MKTYNFYEVLNKLEYNQYAILVVSENKPPFKGIGTVIFYDEKFDGELLFFPSMNPVIVCKSNKDSEADRWIIVDRKELD